MEISIKYQGKRQGYEIPLPSGFIKVNGGDVFKVEGKDAKHMKAVIDNEKKGCESLSGRAFALVSEIELASFENEDFDSSDTEDNSEATQSEVGNLSELSYSELKALAKEREIPFRGNISKDDLLGLLEQESE